MREISRLSPNWSPRPSGIYDVWGVIIHHTATPGSSAIAVADYFRKPESKVSAHVVIGEDGLVVWCVPVRHAAWHAGRSRYDLDHDGRIEDWENQINTHTIGVELCNKGDGRDSYPDIQVKTLAQLIRRWDLQCPNLRYRNITDHEAVNLLGKIDVQPNFPAAKLFWWILHPRSEVPQNVYSKLPDWAKRQVLEIKE